MTNPVTLHAPAKLNLGLKITGLRESGPYAGYHEIESLFTPVTLFDELHVSPAPADEIKYFNGQGGHSLKFENDTLSKALGFFRTSIGPVPFLSIHVRKSIPTGAGMGGGSSDAGRFLRFLKDVFSPGTPEDALSELALRVGADVPFFLQSKPALITGIGENIQPVELEPLAFVIIQPDFEISTKQAYGWYDKETKLTRRNTDATPGMIIEVSGLSPRRKKLPLSLLKFGAPEIIENLRNDFEKSVEKRHPGIAMMKRALRQRGALGTLMSGTGSSVYGIFRNLTEAVSVRESLQDILPENHVFFVCETLLTGFAKSV